MIICSLFLDQWNIRMSHFRLWAQSVWWNNEEGETQMHLCDVVCGNVIGWCLYNQYIREWPNFIATVQPSHKDPICSCSYECRLVGIPIWICRSRPIRSTRERNKIKSSISSCILLVVSSRFEGCPGSCTARFIRCLFLKHGWQAKVRLPTTRAPYAYVKHIAHKHKFSGQDHIQQGASTSL